MSDTKFDNTRMEMKAFHSANKKADLKNAKGNANWLGLVPKGLSCASQVANTRESNYTVEGQDNHARHIMKSWNMHYKMLDFIKSLENDAGQMPEFVWKERNRIIKEAKRS